MFKHILLPTDGSEASLRAVAKGAELAKAVGAQVTIMIAIEHFSMGILGGSHRTEDDPLNTAAKEAAMHWLAASQAVVAKLGITANQLVLQQRTVHQCILDAAQSTGADLIVMGTHGAGAFERLIVGSQTQRVLAHTTIPVLVLR